MIHDVATRSPGGIRRRLKLYSVLIAVLAASNGLLSFGLVSERIKAGRTKALLEDRNEKLTSAEYLLSGFRRAVMRSPLGEDFLRGTVVQTDTGVSFDLPPDGVFHVLDRFCSACTVNVPFLNSLMRQSDFTVYGVSFESPELLKDLVSRHGIEFPVAALVQGKLPPCFPATSPL